VGFEFAGAVLGLALVGWWLDKKYGWSPWGVLIGAGLGLIGGTYNLIRESLMAFKDADRQRKSRYGAAATKSGQLQQRVDDRRQKAQQQPNNRMSNSSRKSGGQRTKNREFRNSDPDINE
jgi:hypothetical protein